MKGPPNVTGISPAEGPPGTRVILRGENLGKDEKDLIGLTICGENCLMSAEWKSPNKIVARSGKVKGKGDVIVTTKSGGVGTCTVQFKGLFIIPGPLQDSAIWVEEVDPVELDATGEARPVSPQLVITDNDPLGIYEELIRSSIPDEQLEDMFPDSCGNMTSENFTPAWFLLEKHKDTSFTSLMEGLERLTVEESKRSTGPLAFAKKNVHTLMDSLETLSSVQKMMLKDESESEGGSIVEMLESILQGANTSADALFQDVLRRQDDADSTRNALNVLQRFKFLFSLPQSIERNILQGDYDMVINDYGRSKSVFTGTEIKLFKKVLQEVDSKVEWFRNRLKARLQELPAPLEEQKRFIRYLVELDTPGDPAWDCLSYHQQWLVKLLTDCKDEHQGKDDAGYLSTPCFEVDHRATRGDSLKKQNIGVSLSNYQGYSSNSLGRGSKQGSLKLNTLPPQRVVFVEELSELLTESLPDLWKLGQAYFSGSLTTKGGSQSPIKPLSGSKEKQTSFEFMMKEVVALYSSYIRGAFFPEYLQGLSESERNKVGGWGNSEPNLSLWLPSLIRQVRACLSSLSSLSLPGEMLQSIEQLALDLRTLCATKVFSEATEEIKHLNTSETWELEYHESGSCITQLPLLYDSIVVKTLKVLREVIMEVKPGESEFTALQNKSGKMFEDMLKAVVECLQNLAFQPEQENGKAALLDVPAKTSITSTLSGSNDALIDEEEDGGQVTDERLLIVLSNCNFIQHIILPKLLEIYCNDNYPNADNVKTNVLAALSQLEDKVFKLYIENKGEPLIGVLETGMVAGGFRWDFCPQPTDVRNYVKEAIMNLVTVHAQVSAVCASSLSKVLSRLSDRLCEELFRLFRCIPKLSKNGALQGYLELKAFEFALQHHQSDNSKDILEKLLPNVTAADELELIDNLLSSFKSRMDFQLRCFLCEEEKPAEEVDR